MANSKFRLFAGPNASGKTWLFDKFRKEKLIHTEFYVNADRIEKELKKRRKFHFNAYRVKANEEEFKYHILHSGLYSKLGDTTFTDVLHIKSGTLTIPKSVEINSYHASFVASYLVDKLFESKQSFAFETVMSHPSKADLLNLAKIYGYKAYFYFVFTSNLDTNLARAKLRVIDGGHYVDEKHILERAPRVLKLLPEAFLDADSSYVIDNSDQPKLILKKESDILYTSKEYPENITKSIEKIYTAFSDQSKIKEI